MTRRIERIKVTSECLGCKLNQAEAGLLARQLAEAGYRLVAPADKADVYILNTCTVTHIADRESRHRLCLAHRQNPDTRLVAIGCYVEQAPQELAQIEGVELVLTVYQKVTNYSRFSFDFYGYNQSPAPQSNLSRLKEPYSAHAA